VPGPEPQGVREREAAHHDHFAEALDPAAMPPVPEGRHEKALFAALGDVSGRRVLELGCGHGDLTLQLAGRGAEVVAVDVSAGLVDVLRARAELFCPGLSLDTRVAPVEHTGLQDGSFDVVTGKWILHHADVRATAAEIRRVLRPGGEGVFFENQGVNPLLAFARAHLVGRFGIHRFGTEDEHPLTRADYRLYALMFARLELEYPDFHFFELLSRQVLTRHNRLRGATRRFDRFLWERVPALRPYSFHVIVRMTSASGSAA
jgi:ubiquinone/menaquinone biosynthesis C-methylase UbiE